MKEITYQMANGQAVKFTVSEEFYIKYQKIDKEYRRNEEKYSWRRRKRETSFEYLQDEKGFDVEDDNPSAEEQAITKEFLLKFIPLLTEAQRTIFQKAYIESKTLREVAREMSIKLSNVQKQVLFIQKKFLKNFLKKGGQNGYSHSFIVKGLDKNSKTNRRHKRC